MLPPVVTGAVVMLIGFNLAPIVARVYWPQDQWVALSGDGLHHRRQRGLRGFLSRIAIFLGVIFGYLLSWLLDTLVGPDHAADGTGDVTDHLRVNWAPSGQRRLVRLPRPQHGPAPGPAPTSSSPLIALPVVIALIAENTGHVKAVGEMTGDRPGPEWAAPSPPTASATVARHLGRRLPDHHLRREHRRHGRHPGVLHGRLLRGGPGRRSCSASRPSSAPSSARRPVGVLGGITVVLYGMIGLLGAKIWVENRVDFAQSGQSGAARGRHHHRRRRREPALQRRFSLSGIALGTIVAILGYHAARLLDARRGGSGVSFLPHADPGTRPHRLTLGRRRHTGRTAGRALRPAHRSSPTPCSGIGETDCPAPGFAEAPARSAPSGRVGARRRAGTPCGIPALRVGSADGQLFFWISAHWRSTSSRPPHMKNACSATWS